MPEKRIDLRIRSKPYGTMIVYSMKNEVRDHVMKKPFQNERAFFQTEKLYAFEVVMLYSSIFR